MRQLAVSIEFPGLFDEHRHGPFIPGTPERNDEVIERTRRRTIVPTALESPALIPLTRADGIQQALHPRVIIQQAKHMRVAQFDFLLIRCPIGLAHQGYRHLRLRQDLCNARIVAPQTFHRILNDLRTQRVTVLGPDKGFRDRSDIHQVAL